MVFFWDLTSGEVHSKNVGNLKFLAAHGDICAVVVSEKEDGRGGRKQVCVLCTVMYHTLLCFTVLYCRLERERCRWRCRVVVLVNGRRGKHSNRYANEFSAEVSH